MNNLNPGGQLAFQVPNNEDSPYHLCILEVANRPHWQPLLAEVMSPLRYAPMHEYYQILAPHSAHIHMWETRYMQIMDSHQGIED